MIITRTPFRISFFGGGTDYPVWFKEFGGTVLSTTIDKYSYISCRYLPPFFSHKSRIVWSKIESVKSHSKIKHPSVREVLKFLKINSGVELHYDADLPARTGLGSSSTFTVGLLHALHALKGHLTTKNQLAEEAIHIEQAILGENVGSQDQVIAAYGGFNKIEFRRNGNFQVQPITLPSGRLKELEKSLMLIFTGISRMSSKVAKQQIKNTRHKKEELRQMQTMVNQAIDILNSKDNLAEFGKLLHESWKLKRSLTHKISNPYIDGIYEKVLRAGAIGGKLLGAGGGGFLLFFVDPQKRSLIRKRLNKLLEIPFKFENSGSQIVFYKPDFNK